ncbi:MAG: hypothetical protein JW832_12040 [Deltaproteobacteria bacterium]|nr:hypothetical protein [Deltaproteobacteria bacterium]
MKTKFILFLCICCTVAFSCRSGPREKQAPTPQAGLATDNATVQRLITDYAGMRENAFVASAWIAANFTLKDCSSVTMQPVQNYSSMAYPQAQERIEAALREATADTAKNPGGTPVVVTSAITAMHGKPGFLKRFSPSYEDMPSIELEVVFLDARSQRAVVKFCHMTRAKDTDQALDQLLRDITAFLDKKP